MNRTLLLIALISACVLLWACAGDDDDDFTDGDDDDAGDDDDDAGDDDDEGPTDFEPVPLVDEIVCREIASPPLLDGSITFDEWREASAYDGRFRFVGAGGETLAETYPVLILAGNDAESLYLGLIVTDPTADGEIDPDGTFDSVDIADVVFGADDRLPGEVDDIHRAAPFWGSTYFDLVGPSPASPADDRRFDGMAHMVYGEGEYHIEFRIPLDSGDDQDIAIAPGDSIPANLRYLEYHLDEPSLSRVGQVYGDPAVETVDDWLTLRTVASTAGMTPPAPALSGSIVLASSVDDPNMDLYFGPAEDGDFANLTALPVHIMNPSLSRDGQWIAFHGSTAEDDYAHYEIYKIRTNGTELTQLTDNDLLDGHPGWSPDGGELVYVTFPNETENQEGQIFLMDADGTNVRRLTETDGDENDPDFSPDGSRIVFKSKRWTGKEQIATMAVDGSNVVRLTANDYSDHDPIYSPDGEWIVFERYEGPGEWYDPENTFAYPWNVYMIRADGSGEEARLTDDGTVNWLPVFSPDGGSVLYLKSLCPGYTPLYLLDLATGDQWRVLDDWTKLSYVDWR